jgi:hypothetical protein
MGLRLPGSSTRQVVIRPHWSCPFVSLLVSPVLLQGHCFQVLHASLQPVIHLVNMLVTRAPAKLTDSRTTDLRTRLLEELKISLKVRNIQYEGRCRY